MKSRQTMFYITLDDIKPIIQEIEAQEDIKCYLTGMFAHKDMVEYQSLLQVPNIGYTNEGDWNRINNFIILPKKATLNIMTVPQRKGGEMFAVDQLINPASIVIKLGGIYRATPEVLIAGRVGTVSEDAFSVKLYDLFAKKIKKKFKARLGMFYVGPEASTKMSSGWRLETII